MTTATAAQGLAKLPAAPFVSSVMQIEPQWIDYNGHLNMAYYNVMMDRAIDELWLQLGIGPTYMKERHGSTFTAECHVRYLREIHLGDPVQVTIYLLGADEKRIAHVRGAAPCRPKAGCRRRRRTSRCTSTWRRARWRRFRPTSAPASPRSSVLHAARAAAGGHRPQGGDALSEMISR